MNESKYNSFLEKAFTVGTAECAVFSALSAMVLGLLLLTIGFWKTVWVALFMAVGLFIGGVKDKKNCVKRVLNRLFPEKKAKPVKVEHPEISRAVRAALDKKDEAPKA